MASPGLIHIDNPSIRLPGFDIPRNMCYHLNRIRSNIGFVLIYCTNSVLPSPVFDCGAELQTIVTQCPIRSNPENIADFF